MVRQDHSLAKMTAVWLLPFVTIIVASSTGGDIAVPLMQINRTLAILTAGFSFTMVLIGLSLACMMITIYLLRLIVHGPPDISLILSAFIVLGPLGQGGFSLLASGLNISKLLPTHIEGNFPESPLTGQILYGVCFAGAYLAWSAGLCWVIVACTFHSNFVSITPLTRSHRYFHWEPVTQRQDPLLAGVLGHGLPRTSIPGLTCAQCGVTDKCFVSTVSTLACVVNSLWSLRALSSAATLHSGAVSTTSLILLLETYILLVSSDGSDLAGKCHHDHPRSHRRLHLQGTISCGSRSRTSDCFERAQACST